MKNFEKYKTAKERQVAFEEWCRNTQHTVGCAHCKVTEDRHGFICCILEWLDLEAEEEKPMPCPFCGGDCCIVHDAKEAFVQCGNDACMYSGGLAITIDAAIAAHNRLFKAVAAYKENN